MTIYLLRISLTQYFNLNEHPLTGNWVSMNRLTGLEPSHFLCIYLSFLSIKLRNRPKIWLAKLGAATGKLSYLPMNTVR